MVPDNYLRFVTERHRVWAARQLDLPQPWTDNPVLASHKFTNVFRVLDPGTQFILTDLLEPDLDPRDQLMRLFLYRHTGRVETWEYLHVMLGAYPTMDSLADVLDVWREYRSSGRRVFTNAYVVTPFSGDKGSDKLSSVLRVAGETFTPGFVAQWELAETQAARFGVLKAVRGIGDFMAMQILTDWAYSQDQDLEDKFVMPGPGCVNGARALDPTARALDVVHRALAAVRELPDCPRLGDRKPSLMDIQNTLCEYSKYVRYQQRPPLQSVYCPAHPGAQPDPVLPTYYR